MSIQKKIAHGTFWALLEKMGQQGLSFIVFMVLARILGPEDFGMVNLCYVYITISYFLITGAMDGIVSLQIREDKPLSTMFWTVMGIGVALAVMCYASAEAFAGFMKHAEIKGILQWLALVPVLIAGQAVPYALVMKSMDFRVFTIRTIIANVAGGVTGVTLALMGWGAYALVAQQLVMYFATNLVIWPGCGWRPKFMYDPKVLAEVMAPGAKTSSSYVMDFFDQQAPRLIVGSVLGVAAVGYYTLVTRIRQALYDVLIHPLTVVLYPAFAEIKDDNAAQKRVLGQTMALIGAMIFPAIGGAAAMAEVYVPVLFGEAWRPAIPVMSILLLTGASLPFIVVLRDVMRAHNKTGPFLKMQVGLVVCNLALAAVLAPYGLVAMCYGWVAVAVIAFPAYLWVMNRCTGLSLWGDFARLGLPLGCAVAMAGAVILFNHSPVKPGNVYVTMVADVVLGGVVYLAAGFVVMRREVAMIREVAGKILKRKKVAVVTETS